MFVFVCFNHGFQFSPANYIVIFLHIWALKQILLERLSSNLRCPYTATLNSHLSTKHVQAPLPISMFHHFILRSVRESSIAWESAQLSTWVKSRIYDWPSLSFLGTLDLVGDLKITSEE